MNGFLTSVLTNLIPSHNLFVANLIGGSVGNGFTESLNNLDLPESEDKSVLQILFDSVAAGGAQMVAGGGPDKLSMLINNGFSITDGEGVTRIAGGVWDLYKMVFSVGAGTTVGYVTGSAWERFNSLMPDIEKNNIPISGTVF